MEKVTYVFNREPKFRRLLYGSLVGFLFMIAVGIPLLLGYMSRIISEVHNKDSVVPPTYKPLRDLVVRGANILILAILTFGVPISGVSLINRIINSTYLGTVSTQEIGILIVSSGSLTLMSALGLYVFPSLMIHYSINRDSWLNSYRLSNVRDSIVSSSYFVLMIKFVAYSSIFGTISIIATNAVIFTPLAAVGVFTYGGIVARLFGEFARKNGGRFTS
jgi:hypothetical protein